MSAGEMSTSPGLPTPGHAAYEELTAGFALNALEPGEEELLLAHLPDCERCQDALIAHQEVAASLAYALPSVALPPISPELAACMASKPRQLPLDPFVTSDAVRRLSPRIVSSRRSLVTRQARRVLVGAGALGIVAAVGLSGYDVHLRSSPAKTTASSSQAVVQAITERGATIEHLTGGTNTTGTAVISDGHAYLVASGLPSTSKSTSYVVWNVENAKQPVALQRFVSAGTSTPVVVDLGAAKSTLAQSYAVTLEPTSKSAPLPAAPSNTYALLEDAHTS